MKGPSLQFILLGSQLFQNRQHMTFFRFFHRTHVGFPLALVHLFKHFGHSEMKRLCFASVIKSENIATATRRIWHDGHSPCCGFFRLLLMTKYLSELFRGDALAVVGDWGRHFSQVNRKNSEWAFSLVYCEVVVHCFLASLLWVRCVILFRFASLPLLSSSMAHMALMHRSNSSGWGGNTNSPFHSLSSTTRSLGPPWKYIHPSNSCWPTLNGPNCQNRSRNWTRKKRCFIFSRAKKIQIMGLQPFFNQTHEYVVRVVCILALLVVEVSDVLSFLLVVPRWVVCVVRVWDTLLVVVLWSTVFDVMCEDRHVVQGGSRNQFEDQEHSWVVENFVMGLGRSQFVCWWLHDYMTWIEHTSQNREGVKPANFFLKFFHPKHLSRWPPESVQEGCSSQKKNKKKVCPASPPAFFGGGVPSMRCSANHFKTEKYFF